MEARLRMGRGCRLALLALLIQAPVFSLHSRDVPPGVVAVLAIEGKVEVLRAGARTWDYASIEQEKNILHIGDQLRTSGHSLARLRLANQTIATIGPQSQLRVLPPLPRQMSVFEAFKGWFFFLHRDGPGRLRIDTATTTAAIEGTEFSLQVAEADGATRLDLFDGKVSLTNAAGQLTLTSGQAAVTHPGMAPVPTAIIKAVNVIQWNLYYPAVLHSDDLSMSQETCRSLEDSLRAYQRGDLRNALARYPESRSPDSAAETVYRAALWLAAGGVEEAMNSLKPWPALAPDPRAERLADALRLLIAAVKFEARPTSPAGERDRVTRHVSQPFTSSEWLAESYYQQSLSRLGPARDAARQAVALAPGFAFAMVRLAELEFSFGRIKAAQELLARSLALAPDNAQAAALQGFVLAARNQTQPAIAAFDRAIGLDSGLGNAWLGRGLCRIRRGRVDDGLQDLLMAAAVEPQRAVLRSYLGKAFTGDGDLDRARHELVLARRLDPNDPTAWLYSALLNQLDNRINRAMRDLEQSQALNKNRAVYRSRQLLDQDRAVRGVNLANVYADGGMADVAYREAIRAVYDDYANFSTHLLLANSFNRLRDPQQVNLRYESPWLSEYLVANLLAPVGAGTLSPLVSTEEYSRLFERNRLGLVSSTEYSSHGDWLQAAAHYGRVGNWSYALEENYLTQRGYRSNGDLERLTLAFQSKVQLGPWNDAYLQAVYYDAEGGDLAQRYAASDVNRGLRFQESQEPILIAGYHHAWTPTAHTLFLATRVDDTLSVSNPTQAVPSLLLNPGIVSARYDSFGLDYRSDLELYTAELQHFWQWGDHRTILGGRYQSGEVEAHNSMPGLNTAIRTTPPTDAAFAMGIERAAVYGYHHWRPFRPLQFIAGLSFDYICVPANFRSPPLSGGRETQDQVSPKAGLIWSPWAATTVRAAYTRSLGGVSLEQSFQLEPSHVAGFVQHYRSIIPESATGPASVPRHETLGVALDQKFITRTYMGISGEWLESEATRARGAFRFPNTLGQVPGPLIGMPSTTAEELAYRERSLQLTLNQLLGEEWALGCGYRLSRAELEDTFTEVPPGASQAGGFARHQDLEATLHQLQFVASWNSPKGWFARFNSIYSAQSNRGYSPALPGEDFWQFNLVAGYRFARRRAELSVGLLNLTDQDYRLNPLNLTPELPRERTVVTRLRWAF